MKYFVTEPVPWDDRWALWANRVGDDLIGYACDEDSAHHLIPCLKSEVEDSYDTPA